MAFIADCAGIRVDYTHDLDGCGGNGALDMLLAIKKMIGSKVYNNCLEWCAGPGFIGFTALGAKLCNTLDLMEIYEPNRTVVENTIKKNRLESKVRFYLSDNFKSVPKENKYDLIVGNPPHFNSDPYIYFYNDPRKYKDTDWNVHQDFFNNVGDYLAPGGEIFVMESCWGSSPNTFESMLKTNNLRVIDHTRSVQFPNDVWYMRIAGR